MYCAVDWFVAMNTFLPQSRTSNWSRQPLLPWQGQRFSNQSDGYRASLLYGE
jgi:hypothetical protein